MHTYGLAKMRSRGFTLVEVLMVIAILAILAALTFGVAARAKLRAKVTGDMANLRQIGQSIEIYASDNDIRRPYVLDDLVTAGRLDKHLVAGAADPTSEGYANLLRAWFLETFHRQTAKPAPFKLSYCSLSDLGIDRPLTENEEGPRKGWLIFPSEGKLFQTVAVDPRYLAGSYLRLCYDGSVVVRQFRWTKRANSELPGVTDYQLTNPFED